MKKDIKQETLKALLKILIEDNKVMQKMLLLVLNKK